MFGKPFLACTWSNWNGNEQNWGATRLKGKSLRRI